MKEAALQIVPQDVIENKIFLIRGKRVMLDTDLARLYEVPTKRLNEQVKRNRRRFPEDFMFQLTMAERDELVANCDRLVKLKHSTSMPYAFTEQGVSMLSSVLNSERAISVNIQIMRTFTPLEKATDKVGGIPCEANGGLKPPLRNSPLEVASGCL